MLLLSCRLGYSQSLRPTLAGLTVNIDLAATAFLEVQPVSQFILFNIGMRDINDFGRMSPLLKKKASKAIAGIRVSLFFVPAFALSFCRHHFLTCKSHFIVSNPTLEWLLLQVEVRTNGSIRRHKAKTLTENGADEAMFHFDKEDRDISVADYYWIAYKLR